MEELLKQTLKTLEGDVKELATLKTQLLDMSLQQFEYLFELKNDGKLAIESLPKDNIQEIYNTINNDILPLFEESNYKQGIEKIEDWSKLLKENLEK